MNERQSVSIAVLTDNQDDVELVNSALRDAGHAAHCLWISNPAMFDDVLGSEPIELVILNKERYADTIRQVIKQKDAYIPEVHVIATSRTVDEDLILEAMNDGACDLVSFESKARLQAVVTRELRAFRVECALNSTLNSATEYKRQLNDYMQGSKSAIADVHEGIIVDVNNAWLTLFQAKETDEVVGLPLMDNFLPESQAAVKGALVATTKGKWQAGEKLIAKSRFGEGDAATLNMEFHLIESADGPHVQVRIRPPEKPAEEPTKLVHEALKRDPTMLFLHRTQFLDRLSRRLKKKPRSGVHALAYIRPDSFSEVRKSVGILDTEEVLAQFAEEVRKRLHPRDFAGRFEGTAIMALLERGNEKDARTWGGQLVEHIREHEFQVREQQVRLTCTVGVCAVSGVYSDLDELVSAAADAYAKGKAEGGNTAFLDESTDIDTKLRKHDALWVKRIKEAFKENRFRLAQLPIAGLRSDSLKMYDMLVRMLDEQGKAVLPSEFLPAAERNNLMKTIDRWIIAAACEHCANNDVDRVFVRLSRQSMQDKTLLDWMQKEIAQYKIEPSQLCVQIAEQEAARFIKDTKTKVEELRKLGVAFALEHYGIDKKRYQILDILKPDYIKIHGELMHALMTDTELQASVQLLTGEAKKRNIETIAERVENANAMAVLFQLGVHYMQGHYVHEPEVVLQEKAEVVTTTLEAIANS